MYKKYISEEIETTICSPDTNHSDHQKQDILEKPIPRKKHLLECFLSKYS